MNLALDVRIGDLCDYIYIPWMKKGKRGEGEAVNMCCAMAPQRPPALVSPRYCRIGTGSMTLDIKARVTNTAALSDPRLNSLLSYLTNCLPRTKAIRTRYKRQGTKQ